MPTAVGIWVARVLAASLPVASQPAASHLLAPAHMASLGRAVFAIRASAHSRIRTSVLTTGGTVASPESMERSLLQCGSGAECGDGDDGDAVGALVAVAGGRYDAERPRRAFDV